MAYTLYCVHSLFFRGKTFLSVLRGLLLYETKLEISCFIPQGIFTVVSYSVHDMLESQKRDFMNIYWLVTPQNVLPLTYLQDICMLLLYTISFCYCYMPFYCLTNDANYDCTVFSNNSLKT